jgi:hypothetical protein
VHALAIAIGFWLVEGAVEIDQPLAIDHTREHREVVTDLRDVEGIHALATCEQAARLSNP